jgi:hypothetical protein
MTSEGEYKSLPAKTTAGRLKDMVEVVFVCSRETVDALQDVVVWGEAGVHHTRLNAPCGGKDERVRTKHNFWYLL